MPRPRLPATPAGKTAHVYLSQAERRERKHIFRGLRSVYYGCRATSHVTAAVLGARARIYTHGLHKGCGSRKRRAAIRDVRNNRVVYAARRRRLYCSGGPLVFRNTGPVRCFETVESLDRRSSRQRQAGRAPRTRWRSSRRADNEVDIPYRVGGLRFGTHFGLENSGFFCIKWRVIVVCRVRRRTIFFFYSYIKKKKKHRPCTTTITTTTSELTDIIIRVWLRGRNVLLHTECAEWNFLRVAQFTHASVRTHSVTYVHVVSVQIL